MMTPTTSRRRQVSGLLLAVRLMMSVPEDMCNVMGLANDLGCYHSMVMPAKAPMPRAGKFGISEY